MAFGERVFRAWVCMNSVGSEGILSKCHAPSTAFEVPLLVGFAASVASGTVPERVHPTLSSMIDVPDVSLTVD